MKPLATCKILAVMATLATGVCCDAKEPSKDFDQVDGPNVRVMRHEDGARTMFTRSPDDRTLTKKKFSASGVLDMLTVYRMTDTGNPISCKIYDGQGQLMYKVSYGYRKIDFKLVEERMYDARQIRRDKDTGKEMPVQKICYLYDAQGNRSAPIVFNLLPGNGKTFEQIFGVKSSALESNPFKDQKAGGQTKPAGRRAGRGH